MIEQQISLPHLVPLALDVLRTNPLAEGDFYPGDLLHAVLSVDDDYWPAHPDEWYAANEITETLKSALDELREVIERFEKSRP